MNRWIICDADSSHMGQERCSQSFSTCMFFQQNYQSNCLQEKKKPRLQRKPSLKTSLSEVRFNQKPKSNFQASPSRIQTKILQESSFKQIHTKPPYMNIQKISIPEVSLKRLNSPKFNPQVSQAYCTFHRLKEISPIKNYHEKVVPTINDSKINFINPSIQPSTSVSINYLNRQPIIYQQKNLIFLPQQINSQVFVPNGRFNQSIQEQSQMSKSMDCHQPKKIERLPSNKNLDQLEFIRAESVLDSQENEDQISYVLTPRHDQLFKNYQH